MPTKCTNNNQKFAAEISHESTNFADGREKADKNALKFFFAFGKSDFKHKIFRKSSSKHKIFSQTKIDYFNFYEPNNLLSNNILYVNKQLKS